MILIITSHFVEDLKYFGCNILEGKIAAIKKRVKTTQVSWHLNDVFRWPASGNISYCVSSTSKNKCREAITLNKFNALPNFFCEEKIDKVRFLSKRKHKYKYKNMLT